MTFRLTITPAVNGQTTTCICGADSAVTIAVSQNPEELIAVQECLINALLAHLPDNDELFQLSIDKQETANASWCQMKWIDWDGKKARQIAFEDGTTHELR